LTFIIPESVSYICGGITSIAWTVILEILYSSDYVEKPGPLYTFRRKCSWGLNREIIKAQLFQCIFQGRFCLEMFRQLNPNMAMLHIVRIQYMDSLP
jgi:hypothetical protein